MKNRINKLLAAAAIALLSIFATATAASAHAGLLNATYTCQADGTYKATYSLTLTKADNLTASTMWRIGTAKFESTPTSNSGMTNGPVASKGNETIALGSQTLPGNTTSPPWVYAYSTFSDGFAIGADGRTDVIKGDCKPVDKQVPIPAKPTQNDPCGKNNATWNVPANSPQIMWSLTNGTLTASTTPGNIFTDGTKVKDFGKAIDSSVECVVVTTTTVPAPTTTVPAPTTTVPTPTTTPATTVPATVLTVPETIPETTTTTTPAVAVVIPETTTTTPAVVQLGDPPVPAPTLPQPVLTVPETPVVLPATGSSSVPISAGAAAAIVAGIGLLAVRRKRLIGF